jgi:hypothetical protein
MAMTPSDHEEHAAGANPSWPAARIVSLALLGLLTVWMVYMHRVDVVTADLLPIALLAACLILHVFMHRGHGAGHAKREGRASRTDDARPRSHPARRAADMDPARPLEGGPR